MNRLTDKKFPTNAVLDAQYKHDLGSRLIDADIVAVDGAKNHFTYDALNRMSTNTQTLGNTPYALSYSYDKAGNRTKITYPSGKVVEYVPDALDRMDVVKVDASNFVDYSYDPLDRRSQKDYLVGVKQQTVYGFDIADQLKNLTNKFTAGGNISQFGYPDYDNAGNRLTMTAAVAAGFSLRTLKGATTDSADDDSIQTTNYVYNDIYELTAVSGSQTHTYTHDNVGNRELADGVIYVPNNLNQYDSVGGVTFTYDLNGNLTDDGPNSYTYDEENRMATMQNARHSAQYEYDAFNYRISKRVDGLTTYFIYDGDEIIEERDASGNLKIEYIYGDYIDEILAMSKDGKTYYYHADGLGSITDITDSEGNIVETYTYDVYGSPSRLSTIGNRYMFTGREFDEESGTYYFRLRNYHPQIGRFMQRDPIGYWNSMNLFEYVGNSPTNWIDPWGEQYMPYMPWTPPLSPIGGGQGMYVPPQPGTSPQPEVSLPNAPQPVAPGSNKCSQGGPNSGYQPPGQLMSNSGNQGSGGHEPKKQSTGSYKGPKKERHQNPRPGRLNEKKKLKPEWRRNPNKRR